MPSEPAILVEQQSQQQPETGLTTFKKQDAAIAKMAADYKGLTVAKDSYKVVRTARIEMKNFRCAVETLREKLKREPWELCKSIDAEAKRHTELIEPIESALEKEEKAEDARKAAEAKAILGQEQARLKEIQAARIAKQNERIAKLSSAGAVLTANDLATIGQLTDGQFENLLKDETIKAQQSKAAAAKAEAEKQELLKKQAEELRVRQEEQEKERKVAEAKLAADRAKLETEQAELRKQQEEVNRRNQELREKAEAEELRQHRQRQEEQRIADQRAAEWKRNEILNEKARQAEELRLNIEAIKPELEKFETVLKAIRDAAGKAVLEAGEPWWCIELDSGLNALGADMRLLISDKTQALPTATDLNDI